MFSEDIEQISNEETLEQVSGGCFFCGSTSHTGDGGIIGYGSGLNRQTSTSAVVPPTPQVMSPSSSTGSSSDITTEVAGVTKNLYKWRNAGKK